MGGVPHIGCEGICRNCSFDVLDERVVFRRTAEGRAVVRGVLLTDRLPPGQKNAPAFSALPAARLGIQSTKNNQLNLRPLLAAILIRSAFRTGVGRVPTLR